MLARLEEVMLTERPDWVIVRGDTNSTLAGALAASKLGIPLAHVEAGARSFGGTCPRRSTGSWPTTSRMCCSASRPAPWRTWPRRASPEGFTTSAMSCTTPFSSIFRLPEAKSTIAGSLGLTEKGYLFATVHRAANTDDPERLRNIVDALNGLDEPLCSPCIPGPARRSKPIAGTRPNVRAIEPVGYLDMLALEDGARLILTDSGGVTREAYFLGVPCVSLREESEHVDTVRHGWNTLAGADPVRIARAARIFSANGSRPPVFGDGSAAQKIVSLIIAGPLPSRPIAAA